MPEMQRGLGKSTRRVVRKQWSGSCNKIILINSTKRSFEFFFTKKQPQRLQSRDVDFDNLKQKSRPRRCKEIKQI
jgi:hypothetical protein